MDPFRRLMSMEQERREKLREIQETAERVRVLSASLARQIREYRGQNEGDPDA
jgi:hypothetical protein